MRALPFADALVVACAVLVLALVAFATPDPGSADPSGARSETTMTADDLGAVVQQEHGGATERSCHPDLECSPSAIFAVGPALSEGRIHVGKRRHIKAFRLGGLAGVVDLPPPRTGAGAQSHTKRYTQI